MNKRMTATEQGACRSATCATEPRLISGRPPRPRAPSTRSCASPAAVSSAARGEPWETCRTTVTSGCAFSCSVITESKVCSIWCAPPSPPEASMVAHTANSGTLRSAASSNANGSTDRTAADPSTPTTIGPGVRLAGCQAPRTTTMRPSPRPASCQATGPSGGPLRSPLPQAWANLAPCPRAPTTTISAAALCSHSTWAGGPLATSRHTRASPSLDRAWPSPRSRISLARCVASA